MTRMACITHNSVCFVREGVGVCVFQRRKWCVNDPSSCGHHPLQGSPVVVCAAPTPQSDAAGENDVDGPSVKRNNDGWWRTCKLEFV